jgi:hypothetical protein
MTSRAVCCSTRLRGSPLPKGDTCHTLLVAFRSRYACLRCNQRSLASPARNGCSWVKTLSFQVVSALHSYGGTTVVPGAVALANRSSPIPTMCRCISTLNGLGPLGKLLSHLSQSRHHRMRLSGVPRVSLRHLIIVRSLPQGLPSGKSENMNRATPHCSTISRAQPNTTVGRPWASKWRETRLTVWWQTGQTAASRTTSTSSSRHHCAICGASTWLVFR